MIPIDYQKGKLVIAFLKNPDPVVATKLDDKLKISLEEAGVKVVNVDLNNISIKMSHENGL